MGRVAAFDWGTKRIGVAVSDEERMLAHKARVELKNDPSLYPGIQKFFREYQPEKILVGLPKSLSGELTESALKALAFGKELSRKFGIRVEFLDERFSTKTAQQKLKAGGKNFKQSRGDIDNTVAQSMLQQYLDRGKIP